MAADVALGQKKNAVPLLMQAPFGDKRKRKDEKEEAGPPQKKKAHGL